MCSIVPFVIPALCDCPVQKYKVGFEIYTMKNSKILFLAVPLLFFLILSTANAQFSLGVEGTVLRNRVVKHIAGINGTFESDLSPNIGAGGQLVGMYFISKRFALLAPLGYYYLPFRHKDFRGVFDQHFLGAGLGGRARIWRRAGVEVHGNILRKLNEVGPNPSKSASVLFSGRAFCGLFPNGEFFLVYHRNLTPYAGVGNGVEYFNQGFGAGLRYTLWNPVNP